jgi:hypothetical protein
MRVARVPNNHISTVVLDGVLHDSDRHYNVISDATNAKRIAIDANVTEHNRNNWDIVHVCVVDQHTASGDINGCECNSCCRH